MKNSDNDKKSFAAMMWESVPEWKKEQMQEHNSESVNIDGESQ